MKKYLFFLFLSLGLTAKAQRGDLSLPEKNSTGCRMVKIETEHLPDLNIPRSGHTFYWVNGQPTVIGGHTSGFVLTPTIEYFCEYAKDLMLKQPDIKMTTICTESGFNNETSFFRAFKAHTGKTLREWMGST